MNKSLTNKLDSHHNSIMVHLTNIDVSTVVSPRRWMQWKRRNRRGRVRLKCLISSASTISHALSVHKGEDAVGVLLDTFLVGKTGLAGRTLKKNGMWIYLIEQFSAKSESQVYSSIMERCCRKTLWTCWDSAVGSWSIVLISYLL